MHSFKDNRARLWTLHITVAALKRVRAIAGIDLANIIVLDPGQKPNAELLQRLSDPILLVDTLYAVCKPEADKRGVSDVDFGESMAGDSIEEATAALLDDLVDFFPMEKRQVFRRILQASRCFSEAAKAELTRVVETGELDRVLDKAGGQLTQSFRNARESSESTPDRSLSAS